MARALPRTTPRVLTAGFRSRGVAIPWANLSRGAGSRRPLPDHLQRQRHHLRVSVAGAETRAETRTVGVKENTAVTKFLEVHARPQRLQVGIGFQFLQVRWRFEEVFARRGTRLRESCSCRNNHLGNDAAFVDFWRSGQARCRSLQFPSGNGAPTTSPSALPQLSNVSHAQPAPTRTLRRKCLSRCGLRNNE
jgi:hypothetical protein